MRWLAGVELETNMPTTINIPSRRARHCSPCEHLKSNGGMRGGPGNVWDWWCCMHPEANNTSPLSDDPKIRDKQIELRARMAEHGRSIGKSAFAKQPEWCPLLREQAG